jgi:hypothetical protein
MKKPEFAAHTPSDARPDDEWHGLKEHLESVAAEAEAKANKFQAGRLAYYAGLWHDLGKYNPKFQDFLRKAHDAKLAGQKLAAAKVPHAIGVAESGYESMQGQVLLVESAIDALSLAALEREKLTQQSTTVYLSTDGSGAIPVNALQSLLASEGKVLVAFDADQAGEKMAWRIAAVLGVRQMVPAIGKDWNDRLLAEQRNSVLKYTDRQSFKQFWIWYRVANIVGYSAAYLNRITEVARHVLDGNQLSEKAIRAMEQDFKLMERNQADKAQSTVVKVASSSTLNA